MRRRLLFVPVLLGLGLVACSEDEMDLVTIEGVVLSIDTLEPAVGVRVSLLDTDYRDQVATGDDGAFAIRVPKGSTLHLHTDDFDPAGSDLWLPLINADYPGIVANENISDWVAHACPYSRIPSLGSVAAWDNFLGNYDNDHGDRFDPDSTTEAGGILSVLFFHVNEGVLEFPEGIHVEVTEPGFPQGYIRYENIFTPDLVPDHSLGPDIFFPPDRTTTDGASWFQSFAAPDYETREVSLVIEDFDTERGIQYVRPFRVPVRPGTITLVLPGSIGTEGDKHFLETFAAADE